MYNAVQGRKVSSLKSSYVIFFFSFAKAKPVHHSKEKPPKTSKASHCLKEKERSSVSAKEAVIIRQNGAWGKSLFFLPNGAKVPFRCFRKKSKKSAKDSQVHQICHNDTHPLTDFIQLRNWKIWKKNSPKDFSKRLVLSRHSCSAQKETTNMFLGKTNNPTFTDVFTIASRFQLPICDRI